MDRFTLNHTKRRNGISPKEFSGTSSVNSFSSYQVRERLDDETSSQHKNCIIVHGEQRRPMADGLGKVAIRKVKPFMEEDATPPFLWRLLSKHAGAPRIVDLLSLDVVGGRSSKY